MTAMIIDGISDKVKYGSTERIGMYSVLNGDARLFVNGLDSERDAELTSSFDGNANFWVKK